MARRNKNPILENLHIESVGAEGKAIAKKDDRVIFVELAAPGDVLDARITKKKKSFFYATPIKFHKYADIRKDPFCSHFGLCGGCKWQHMPYEEQLKFKRQQVIDSLERIAKVGLPSIPKALPSSQTEYYRNKLEFTFSNKRWLTDKEVKSEEELSRDALGFHIPGKFDKILDIDHCYLQGDPSNEVRIALRDYAKEKGYSFYDILAHEGLLRNVIIRIASTDQLMVIVQFGQNDKGSIEDIMFFLQQKFNAITSLYYVVNTKKNETFFDLDLKLFSGMTYIEEKMEDLIFRIGPKSFYQTNSIQAYELYKVVRNFADFKGDEVVYDLYTGTGTIANFIANSVKRVVGVEYVPEAIEDAKVNAKENKIDNASFFAGDIKYILNESFTNEQGMPDVIITDPPRAGMHKDVVETLLGISAKVIIYVSCNPATQARDLALLDSKYKVTGVQPVDMFPHTHHIENVVKLELR